MLQKSALNTLSCGRWRGHVREYILKEISYICRTAGFEILTEAPSPQERLP
jgi:hypothetical protein